MKKISTRILSVFMALVMVISIIPMFTITASANVNWTAIASSDFSQATGVANNSAMTTPTYNGQGSTMTWSNVAWTGNGDVVKEADAVYIPDGYMYMSGYGDGQGTPLRSGLSAWKIDFGFRFKDATIDGTYSSDNVYDTSKTAAQNEKQHCLFKAFVYTNNLQDVKPTNDLDGYCYLAQDAAGKLYSWDTDLSVGSTSTNTCVGTASDNLSAGVNYHYVVEYTGTYFRAYITDDYGKVVQEIAYCDNTVNSTFMSRLANIGSNTVNSFKIGDFKQTAYYRGLEYRNITFYSGEVVDETNQQSGDKYLLTYFTGNNAEGEQLRYAVSSDGVNYQPLNKAMPVWTGEGQTITSYPTGGEQGIAVSKHIRDPYVFKGGNGKYYVLATDLNSSVAFSNNSKILVWELTNLEDIATTTPWAIDTQEWKTTLALNSSGEYDTDNPNVKRAWAPQAIWDAVEGKYMLYWSAGTGSTLTHPTYLYYVYTSDFKTFDGAPRRLINTGSNTIDGDITYDSTSKLYYMYFKNEGTGTISYATATRPCGPYTNVQSTSISIGAAEGPQVYSDGSGNYTLLADEYGANAAPGGSKQGVFHLYQSNSLTGFSSETTTNIPYLYCRHGSVVRISTAEYNALVSEFGVPSTTDMEFLFTGGTSASSSGWVGSTKDPGGYIFKIHGFDGSLSQSYSAVNGVLTLTNKCAMIEEATAQNWLMDRNFTISFKHTVSSSSYISNSVPILIVGNMDEDYIELYEDGTFKVGSSTVTAVNSFTNAQNAEHEYTISLVKSSSDSSKATAILLIDGVYMGSATLSGDITKATSNNSLYVALGGCDIHPTCTSGTYTDLVISHSTLDPNDYAVNCSSLSEAIDLFEDRVEAMGTSGYTSLYTNIGPAYELYKQAKAFSGTPSQEATLLDNFNLALDAMKPFVEFSTGNYNPFEDEDNFDPASNWYSNVIYAEGATDGDYDFSDNSTAEIYGETNSSWKYGAHAYIYYPHIVLLYDGKTTPGVPTVAGFINKDHRYSVNMLYLTDEMSDFGLRNSYWRGYRDSQTFLWPKSTDTVNANQDAIPISKSNTSENSLAETINHDADNDTTTYRIYKNVLDFTATPTNAYTCYSSSDWSMCGQYTYIATNKQIYTDLTNNDSDIVVLNYKMLIDALKDTVNDSDHKTWFGNISTQYTEAGLEGIFTALDAATSLNPSTGISYYDYKSETTVAHAYDYDGNDRVYSATEEPMDIAALLCGSDIDDVVDLLGAVRITSDKADIARLKAAISAYETKMAGMRSVYTNLETAYNWYTKAVDYVDAYEYGGRTGDYFDPAIITVAQSLETATDAMSAWTAPTTLSSGIRFPGDGSDISSSYYNKVIYWGSVGGSIAGSGEKKKDHRDFAVSMSAGNGAHTSVNYPTTVLLYDSSTDRPKMPILCAMYTASKNTRNVYFLYPTLSDSSDSASDTFSLDQTWHGEAAYDYGQNGTVTQHWIEAFAQNGSGKSYGTSNTTNSELSNVTWMRGFGTNTTFGGDYFYTNIGANTMTFIGSGNTDDYYERITTYWYSYVGANYSNGQTANDQARASSTVPIYVINYEPVKTKIGTLQSAFASGITISNYREGGLATWLGQVDDLTEINPMASKYTYSTNVAVAVTNCANDIKAAVNTTNGTTKDMATSITNPAAGNSSSISADTKINDDVYTDGVLNDYDDVTSVYTKLKIAIKEAEAAPKAQGCIVSAAWSAYTTAKTAAVTAAYDIADTAYTDADVLTKANALHNAISALSTPSNSAHPIKYSYAEGDYMYYQCNSNNSHILDHEHNSTLDVADATAYNALAMVYTTLDMSKYPSTAALTTAKASFDAAKTAASDAGVTAQAYVDAKTEALLNAIGEANTATSEAASRSYTVNYNVYTINRAGTTTKIDSLCSSTTLVYGQVASITLGDSSLSALGLSSVDDINITQIGVSRSGGAEKKYANTTGVNNSVSVYVEEPLTINVYVQLPAATARTVTIRNIAGNNYWSVDVTDESKIVYSSDSPNTITIDGVAYSVPNTLSYSITGWSLNGGYYSVPDTVDMTVAELIAASGDSSLIFRPATSKNYSSSDKYTITLDGTTAAENVDYDYKLRLTTDTTEHPNAFAIAIYDGEDYIPVAYKASNEDTTVTYRFYVNSSMSFYTIDYSNGNYTVNGKTITDKSVLFYLNNKLPMVYSFADPTGDVNGTKTYNNETVDYSNRWTTRTAFTTNAGTNLTNFKITDCGTLRTTSDLGESGLVIEAVDGSTIKNIVNTNRIAESNQYSYSLKTSGTGVVYTRAYVKYSYTYSGQTIDAIAYGPICTSYYGAS